jgi:type IV fimbrial biogenesis protein FimT
MNYRQPKSKSTLQDGCPFICQFIPFIWFNNPLKSPFVGYKSPFVCKRGFTLIELVVTLTIAGILFAIAAPSMWGFLSSNRLTAQVNDLIADINFARSEAIKRNGTVVICKSDNPTAATPECNETSSDPWETGRLIFLDNEDKTAGITLNYKYLTANNDVLLRIREPLEGDNTLRPNNSSVSTNLSNYLAYSKTGLTTLAAPTVGDGPHRFKVCDKNGKVRGLLLETTGRTSLVSDKAETFTWSETNYTLTCP